MRMADSGRELFTRALSPIRQNHKQGD